MTSLSTAVQRNPASLQARDSLQLPEKTSTTNNLIFPNRCATLKGHATVLGAFLQLTILYNVQAMQVLPEKVVRKIGFVPRAVASQSYHETVSAVVKPLLGIPMPHALLSDIACSSDIQSDIYFSSPHSNILASNFASSIVVFHLSS